MKPSTQCEAAAKKANMTLGKILRSFHYRKSNYLVPLYKTFVRPKLEFAAASWGPWLEKDAEELEKVQKRAVRAMSDARGETYEEKLRDVGLTTLRERRKRGDLIEAFKVIKGHNNVNRESWFDLQSREASRPTRTNATIEEGSERRKSDVLYKPKAQKETRANFYTVRVVQWWNELPEEVKATTSVNSFKNSYDKWSQQERSRIE